MLSILNVNSLVHWEEREILRRENLIRHFSEEVRFFSSAPSTRRGTCAVLKLLRSFLVT